VSHVAQPDSGQSFRSFMKSSDTFVNLAMLAVWIVMVTLSVFSFSHFAIAAFFVFRSATHFLTFLSFFVFGFFVVTLSITMWLPSPITIRFTPVVDLFQVLVGNVDSLPDRLNPGMVAAQFLFQYFELHQQRADRFFSTFMAVGWYCDDRDPR
jgi:hypothetical protein